MKHWQVIIYDEVKKPVNYGISRQSFPKDFLLK